MSSELQSHFTAAKTSIAKRNGAQLASLLALPLRNIPSSAHQFVDKIKSLNVVSMSENSIPDSSLAALVGNRLSALISFMHEDYESGKYAIF